MYGKLFAQMYDGTLATKGPWQALVTFQQLVILADPEGVVDMTVESVARRTTIPLEIIEVGIRALEEPDPASRTPAEEGRRILRLSESRPWGWRIVNYGFYRNIRNEVERRNKRREYHKEYARKRRQQSVNNSQQTQLEVTGVNRVTPSSKKKKEKETTTTTASPAVVTNGQVTWPVEAAQLWAEKVGPITPPRIGRSLKPVVDSNGWSDTKAALECYIELTEGRARDPAWFAKDSVRWLRLGKQTTIDPNSGALTERGSIARQLALRER